LAQAAKSAKPPASSQRLLNPAQLNETAPAQYKVHVSTTKGDFVIQVTRAWAPLAADRFFNLVKNGFYDGCAFYRVLPGFVAQFGLHPNPAIQAKWEKATLADEPVKRSNVLGLVAFAADGANSRNTQVFISLKDNKSLDRLGFPPFGDVVQGIGVLARLHGGYGEKPDSQRILKQGNAYLKRTFPNLDYITKATIQ
jgi:peptidyl-prolyl cis-trans isomerase A (cyclophilin A)